MILVYRYRVKSLNGLLDKSSRAVNDVWNFCNDTLGLKNFATHSTGQKLSNDRFGRCAVEKLAKALVRIARCGSIAFRWRMSNRLLCLSALNG